MPFGVADRPPNFRACALIGQQHVVHELDQPIELDPALCGTGRTSGIPAGQPISDCHALFGSPTGSFEMDANLLRFIQRTAWWLSPSQPNVNRQGGKITQQ